MKIKFLKCFFVTFALSYCAEIVSQNINFTSVNADYAGIPALQEYKARDGAALSYRFYDSKAAISLFLCTDQPGIVAIFSRLLRQ